MEMTKTILKSCLVIILVIFLSGCVSGYKDRINPDREQARFDSMVYVPEGEFIMGSNPDDEKRGIYVGLDELPQRKVFLKGYYIDKYEVTTDLYKKFVDTTGNKTPFDWKDGNYPEGEGYLPVAHIDWYDADAYCKWAGKRLPTEAEWEKAARGTDGRIYPWGDVYDMKKTNTKDWNRERVPVGSLPEGASPYGVMDMAGNIWEWTADWYKPYQGSTLQRDIFGETHKVIRGGGWNSYGELARTNERYPLPPDKPYQCFAGARCVKDD